MLYVKWPNILQISCGVNTTRFLKYVWPFYNIMHERVKLNKNFIQLTAFDWTFGLFICRLLFTVLITDSVNYRN